jgi:hypothetical protein
VLECRVAIQRNVDQKATDGCRVYVIDSIAIQSVAIQNTDNDNERRCRSCGYGCKFIRITSKMGRSSSVLHQIKPCQ